MDSGQSVLPTGENFVEHLNYATAVAKAAI
jgi:hypothetical protein